jgi:hypothetical protein
VDDGEAPTETGPSWTLPEGFGLSARAVCMIPEQIPEWMTEADKKMLGVEVHEAIPADSLGNYWWNVVRCELGRSR